MKRSSSASVLRSTAVRVFRSLTGAAPLKLRPSVQASSCPSLVFRSLTGAAPLKRSSVGVAVMRESAVFRSLTGAAPLKRR